ncbi:MAG: GxxExxY protein [Gemmatimonadota bacterium]
MDVNALTEQVIAGAIEVHRELGPGLLESAYEVCLFQELMERGLRVQRQLPVAITYHGKPVECGYRIDLLVESTVVVEIKSVSGFERIHLAQMLTYLKLSGHRIGLLINFNVPLLKEGVRRVSL